VQDETIAHVELSAQQMLMHNDRGDLRPIELQALQALKDVTDGLLFAVHQSTVPDNCFRLVLAKLLFRTNTHSTGNSDPCILLCCQAHDNCYTKFRCNATSFLPGGFVGGACKACNRAVAACIVGAAGVESTPLP
jgi:hypothetical protein